MCYTPRMIKQLILIAALLPATASAHEWGHEYWLDRLARNHLKTADCYSAIFADEDIVTFRSQCSVHTLGYTENKVMKEYYAEKLHHPLLSDREFIAEHFEIQYVEQILEQVQFVSRINVAIMTMYIAEGLTRNDK